MSNRGCAFDAAELTKPESAMLNEIPGELRALAQWVVWRYEHREGAKPTKVPYQAHSLRLASCNEREHWATFDAAVGSAQTNGMNGIGFVFTDEDPYCGIDLDAATDPQIVAIQQEIYTTLNSYSELSPSGNGLHIICQASVAHGIKHAHVEVYSSQRYFTFTGNVYNPVPIAERQELVFRLWESMRQQSGRSTVEIAFAGELSERADDAEIYRRAAAADNGSKFEALWRGEWDGQTDERTGYPYPSGSEGDFALVNILSFHSGNVLQIDRMFRMSPAGQRAKYAANPRHTNYLITRMIQRSFDMVPPTVDLDSLQNKMSALLAEQMAKPLHDNVDPGVMAEANPYTMPPCTGVLPDILEFIWANSPRQVAEISLAGALGFFAGLVGNAYNVRGNGVNQYILLTANTGVGKEAMASGISRLVRAVYDKANIIQAFVGPTEIASGAALNKALRDHSCFVSILSEFGHRLADMSGDRAAPAQQGLRRVLLEVYGKSGQGQTLGAMAYSDKDKNLKAVQSPALTLLCETTPETLYQNVDERMVADGLLPRFLVIEYTGLRPPNNVYAQQAVVSQGLIDALAGLSVNIAMQIHNKVATPVAYSAEALEYSNQFNTFCDNQINISTKDAMRQLWSRAWMKCEKLAALPAISSNPYAPIITAEQYLWAKAIVVRDVTRLFHRFTTGEIMPSVQASHSAMLAALAKVILDYAHRNANDMRGYAFDVRYRDAGLVGKSFLAQRCGNARAFKDAKFGTPTRNLEEALRQLTEMNLMTEVNTQAEDFISRFGRVPSRTKLYAVNDWEGLSRICA